MFASKATTELNQYIQEKYQSGVQTKINKYFIFQKSIWIHTYVEGGWQGSAAMNPTDITSKSINL